MQKHTKRLFALLLAAVMVAGLLPVSPAMAAADSLTISGYTRVTELPEGGLEDGYYLFVVPYDGNYYMLYPGATGGGENVTNAARLEVSNGAATGYKVGAGTSYDSAAVSADFSLADNLVTPRNESNARGALYAATAVGSGGATYYLCKKGVTGPGGALYQTDCESAFTIHPLTDGCFNLKHDQSSNVIFYVSHMNFNQNSGLDENNVGNFMIFKSDKEPPLPTAQLQALITEAQGLTQTNYTPKTWAALQTALTTAQSAVNGTDRQAMKSAITALAAAKDSLQAKPAVPTIPLSAYTYPAATAETFEAGVYTIFATNTSRTVILHNTNGHTDQSGASAGNGQTGTNLELWRITKVTDANTPTGADAIKIQSVSDNKYLTSAASGTQRALSDSAETFYITKTTGNTYKIKNSSNQHFAFLDNNHWGMSTSGTVQLYKQTADPDKIKTAAEQRPEGGTTQGQPFPAEGLLGGDFFRIPALVTIENGAHAGRIVAMADARWKEMGDGRNIDTLVSYSDDNGATWHYSFPNFFGDTELAAKLRKSAIFIDPVLAQDKDGTLYLMADAFPAGVSTWSGTYQRPQDTTGFEEIEHNGVTKKRMTIYTSPENSAQTDDNYSYYIGDFAPISGSATQYATIWDAYDHSDSGFYVDDHFYLYKKVGAAAVPADDIIYCEQLSGSNGSDGANNGVWVQQNVFFWNATLHVRNAQYLYMIKSTDGGVTWSAPTILNDQVRTGEQRFYGPGPGAGICLEDGTIVLPCYQSSSSGAEFSGFIYSKDGVNWKRTPKLSTGSESTVVQIDDNTIRQFYRDGTPAVCYIDQVKGDNGAWAPTNEVVNTGAVKRTGNQLSAIRYSSKVDGKTIILVSTSTSANDGNAWSRWYGMIHAFQLNTDNTMTLLSTYKVNGEQDWYGYSSLTELGNGTVGLLYEDSHTDAPSKYNHCGIRFVTYSIYDILLPGLVERAEALEEADYTAETWSGLAAPLATAKAVLGGTDTTTTLESAYTALSAALKALRKVEVTISGTVTSANGAVEGAVVTLEDGNYNPVGLTATTDENGAFTFDNENDADVTLSSATAYKLKVQAPGFAYKVTTVNAAAFDTDKVSADNTITLEAQPEATYTNDFNGGDISMLEGATGDAATATLTVVEHNGSKAVKIGGLTGWDTPMHILDKNAHKLRNGVVSMDITPLTNSSQRFGLGLRADGAGKRVWVGHFESNSDKWGFQSYDGSYDSFNSGTPLMMTQNATRHVEVEMTGTTLKLWVDGVYAGERTNNIRNVLGYVGVSSTRSYDQFIIDNIYVRRTDPKSAVTLTATDGTLAGKVVADGEETPFDSGDAVYEGDTVVITGTGDTGKCLGGITLSDTTIEVTKTAVEGGGYQFSFVMPGSPVTVTGNFKTAVTGANITGTKAVGQTLTATALAGGTEIDADSVTYQWFHREQSGTWRACTNGTSQEKNVTNDDQGKLVKVRVEGTGDYAGWVETTTETAIGSALVETAAVTISRDSITLWKNLTTDPDENDNTVMGDSVTLTAAVDPDNAANKTVTWSSEDEDIATVDQDGLVTAVANGTTTVKAEVISADGTPVNDTVTIIVKTSIESITLTKGSDTLEEDSVLTIYANEGDDDQSVTVNAAVNPDASAAGLIWSCSHTGDSKHIFHLGPANSAAGSASGASVAITAYDSHTLVGEETVTVTAPASATPTGTPKSVSFKVRVVHKLDDIEHSVSVADYTGAPKVGDVLKANHSNLTPGFQLDQLDYEWILTKNGTETTVGNNATYKLTADDVGGTIKVKFTATPADGFYYVGSLTSDPTPEVELADGPDKPTLSVTHVNGETKGTITITPVADAEYEYEYRGKTNGVWDETWTDVEDNEISNLEAGDYQVRVKETTTHKAGAAETITIIDETVATTRYDVSVTIAPVVEPAAGTAERSATSVEENGSVTLTVKPANAYMIQSVKNGTETLTGTAGENGTTVYTVNPVTAKVDFVVTFALKKVTITHALTNVKCGEGHTGSEAHEVDYGTHTTVELTPVDNSYELDLGSIKVTQTGNSTALGTDYVTREGGTLTFINGVTQDITITATAAKKKHTVSFNPVVGSNLTTTVDPTGDIDHGGNITVTLHPADGFSVPKSVEVTMEGNSSPTFTYTVGEDGDATLTVSNVTGNVTIKASAVPKTTEVTAASISGDPTQGNTLSITGVMPTGATYSVSWQKADAQDGTYAQVAATDTYQLTADDVGKYFKAVVSGTGDYSGTFTTDPVGPVAAKVVNATGVTITGGNGAVVVGSPLRLTATVAPADATMSAVKWLSSDPSVATVNETTGVVTPVKVGTVSITATVINSDGSDGVTDSIDVTVAPAPIALRLTGAAVETRTLTAELTPAGALGSVQIFWYRVGGSEDILLDNNDQTTYTLTADDIGYRIKVTASAPSDPESNYTGSAEATTPTEVVAVGDEVFVESVTLNRSTASVAIDKTVTLTATIQPTNATNQTLSWVSDNEPVATVDQNGVVTGVAEGSATITVTTEDGGFTAQCVVTVTKTAASTSGGSVGKQPSNPTTTTNNPDGTTTVTETKPDGTKVSTTEKPDGTKETVETKKDGTVTETVETPDGVKEVVETKPDGTVTETVESPDGAKEIVETKPDGTVTETAIDPEGAKTEKVTDPEENVTITVTDAEGEELVKVELPSTIPAPETRFEDVPEDHWAESAINTVAGLGLVKGVDDSRYDMVTPMDRGSLATILYRLSNGKSDYAVSFTDVAEGKYYTEGVAWAAKVGVVTGISKDIFAPEQVITREQLAVMLARYAKLLGMDTKAETTSLNAFADSDKTGTWAVDSVAWCIEKGILRGKGGNILDPAADVTRAEVAVMLERFIGLIK